MPQPIPTCFLLSLCVATLLSASVVDAQTSSSPEESASVAQRMIAYERDSSDVVPNLEYLSDMIGPRLTGSERLKRANDWTAEKMKGYGLENVHLEAWTIPRGWERGVVEARLAAPNGLPVTLAQMAWTPGLRKVNAPVVVFSATTESDLAAYKGKLKGAIVLSGRMPDNPDNPSALELPNSTAPTPIAPLVVARTPVKTNASPMPPTAGPSPGIPAPPPPGEMTRRASFRKATQAFLKAEGVSAILMDANKPHGLLNMTGSWESNSQIPTFFVTHEYVAMIQRLIKRGTPVTMDLKSTAHFVKGPLTVYNTVGEIKGMEKPEEIVLLGAHLDSWDLGTGTTDNGTGSMAVLEAAHLLKSSGVPLKRTVRFVLFTGEEEGLCGSKAYVAAHKEEMSHYNVVFVHDTGTGRVKGAWLQNRAECKPLLEQQFARLKEVGLMTDAPNLLPGKMNGTDHASFDDAGVPAFAYNQDSAEYGLTHHSQSDTFDKVRPDDLKQGACALAIMAYDAAQMLERYPRSAAKKP